MAGMVRCPVCGELFRPRRRGQRYCDERCRRRIQRRRQRERWAADPDRCRMCGRPLPAHYYSYAHCERCRRILREAQARRRAAATQEP